MSLKTYNLKEVILTVNGIPVSGFGDGDAVTVEFSEEAWTMVVGADGEVTRSRTNNESGSFQVTLMQTSEANGIFQQWMQQDKLFGRALVGVTLTDTTRGEVIAATQCWIEQTPSREFNRDAGSRVWTIMAPRLVDEPLSALAFGFDLL